MEPMQTETLATRETAAYDPAKHTTHTTHTTHTMPPTAALSTDSRSISTDISAGEAGIPLTTQPPEKQSRPRGIQAIWAWMLSLSLFYKVLIANSLIVLLGALAGTAITLHVASVRPTTHAMFDVPLTAAFAIVGVLLSCWLNVLLLRAALNPLARLQEVARRVQQGDFTVRAQPSPLADAEIARLADTLNQILDEVQRYDEQMRALSGRVIRAQEDERQRIARELHDDTGQVLTLLLIRLKLLESQPGAEALISQTEELRGLVSGAIDQVRRLALNLRPPAIDQLGLAPALRSLATTFTAGTGLAVKLEVPREPVRLSPEDTIAVYRIAQEALTNIAKHAAARNVEMTVSVKEQTLDLLVRDDGRGFLPADFKRYTDRDRLTKSEPGVGLFGMEERARLAGGRLHLQSTPGRGTSVHFTMPLAPALPYRASLKESADHDE